jgi:endonuclease I
VRCFLLLPCLLPALATDLVLRAQLHEQVRAGATVIPYSSSKFDTSDALAILDALPGDTNTVRLVYGQTTLPTATFGDAGGWNREHLWPNSYGLDDVEPSFSDLHNLRACDSNVNSARGNKFFDVSSAADGNLRNPAHVEAPLCTTDANSWEPPSSQRGDIARSLFFMTIRYEGDAPGEPDLELVENVAQITATNARMRRLSTLLRWNEEDPPDEAERARDAATFAIQGNRNPFVADPTLANRLWLPKVTVARSGEGVVFGLEPTDLPVALEFATNLTGPWTTNAPPTDAAPETFARVRLVP